MDPSTTELDPVKQRYRWLILLGVAAVLLVPAGFAAKWAYAHAKVWRAHALIREAGALLDSHASEEGQSKLMAAYTLEPYDPEVVRAVADEDLSVHNPHALGFYHQLVALPRATREDRRDALRGFLSFGDVKSAEELAVLLIGDAPEAEDYALQAQVCWQGRALPQAMAFMQQALTLDPTNRTDQFLLAQMLAVMPDEKKQADAMDRIHELARTKDQVSLQALEVMARSSRLDVATQQWTLEHLLQHPLLDDEGRFASWELEKRLSPQSAKTVMKEASDYFRSVDPTRKATAARWLYNQGQPELALDLAALPDARANEALFLVRLDALAFLNNWAEVKKELADNNVPLSQSLIYLYRARSAQELGDAAQSAADWGQARIAAETDPGMFPYLGKYAEKMGLYDEARKTYTQMAHNPDQAMAGYTALLQLEAQHGTSGELMDTLKEMMVNLPTQPEPKNDWAYLNLLLNTQVDEASKIAKSLVESDPRMLAYRTTLALACLRKNDPAGAQKVYDGLQIDWNTSPASGKLVYALVLIANGKKDQALALVHDLDRSQLRAEELELWNSYVPPTGASP